jgi:hypothetical protein
VTKENLTHLDGLEPRTWAKYQAEVLIKSSGQFGMRVDLNPILRQRKIIKPIVYDSQLKSDARISPVQDGFRIYMNSLYKSQNMEHRWRFSIAHEIGHTLFYDLKNSPPKHFRILGLTAELEEQICNYFATELLMPEEQVSYQYHSLTENKENANIIATIIQLVRLYDVSFESMCLRIIDELFLWKGLFLSCQWDSKPSIYQPRMRTSTLKTDMAWRVNWRVHTKESCKNLFIPNPDKKAGLFPKLNWPQVEKIIDEMTSGKVQYISLPWSEFGKIGNLRKFLAIFYGDRPIPLWIYKTDPNIPEIWPDDMSSYTKPKKLIKTTYIAIGLDPLD